MIPESEFLAGYSDFSEQAKNPVFWGALEKRVKEENLFLQSEGLCSGPDNQIMGILGGMDDRTFSLDTLEDPLRQNATALSPL